jgi:hypothetical protein
VTRRCVTAAVLAVLATATPALAQRQTTPPPPSGGVEFRPFAIVTIERFTASTTFDATLGSPSQLMWGGGLDVTTRHNVFFDVTVSRLNRDGHRAFVDDTGQAFQLAVPLRVSLTPIEFTVGRRFPPRRRPAARRRRLAVIPYIGAGIGAYRYDETSSSSAAGEDVEATHVGFLAVGGAEFRVSKWIGISADAQYTRVPGILGKGGVSQQVGESDLGGIAGRVRVILGK